VQISKLQQTLALFYPSALRTQNDTVISFSSAQNITIVMIEYLFWRRSLIWAKKMWTRGSWCSWWWLRRSFFFLNIQICDCR